MLHSLREDPALPECSRRSHEQYPNLCRMRSEPRERGAARAVNEQMRLLWLAIDDDGLYLLRRWGAISDVNPIGCALLGYSRDELLALNVLDVLDVQDGLDASAWDAVWASVAPGEARSMDTVASRKDGTRVPVQVRLTPVKSGADVIMVALVRDMSARRETGAEPSRRTEQQAVAVVAQLGRRAVAGVDAAALTRDAVDAVVRVLGVESAEVITSAAGAPAAPAAARGMSATIDEGGGRVRTLAVEAPGRTFSQHESDFVQAVAHVVGAALAREQVDRLRRLEATAAGTAHDLKNLLGVVLNYGAFAVEAAADQPELRADLKEIVEAAERAAAIAAALELQAAQLGARDPTAVEPEPPPLGLGETILVVEDEEAVRRVTARILSESGYEILAAASFEAAASVWETHRATIDLVLTDAILGRRSGADLADVVWQTAPELPVLFISGDTTDLRIRRGSEHRTGIVEKPLGSESLLRSVGAALEGRS
jgi:PAS domain S-box-containing protein